MKNEFNLWSLLGQLAHSSERLKKKQKGSDAYRDAERQKRSALYHLGLLANGLKDLVQRVVR